MEELTPEQRKLIKQALNMWTFYRNGLLYLFISRCLVGFGVNLWEQNPIVGGLLILAGAACAITGLFFVWSGFRIRAILQWRYSEAKANSVAVHFAFADGIPSWTLGALVAKATMQN